MCTFADRRRAKFALVRDTVTFTITNESHLSCHIPISVFFHSQLLFHSSFTGNYFFFFFIPRLSPLVLLLQPLGEDGQRHGPLDLSFPRGRSDGSLGRQAVTVHSSTFSVWRPMPLTALASHLERFRDSFWTTFRRNSSRFRVLQIILIAKHPAYCWPSAHALTGACTRTQVHTCTYTDTDTMPRYWHAHRAGHLPHVSSMSTT